MIKEAVQWNGLEFETEDADVYSPKPASLFFAEAATKLVHPGAASSRYVHRKRCRWHCGRQIRAGFLRRPLRYQ